MADCNSPCPGIVIVPADVDQLVYVQGVNLANCIKFETPTSLVCRVLNNTLPNGQAVPNVTQLMGADCRSYTIPLVSETPFTVVDTPTVDLSVSGTMGHTLSANVIVSAQDGNQIVINTDGLFVDTITTDICPILTNLPTIGGGTVPLNARVVFVDPNGFGCYTGTPPTLCSQLNQLDTAVDLLVPGTADVAYVRVDGTCGRAPLPSGFAISECSIGSVITTDSVPDKLVGLSAGGCLVSVPACSVLNPLFIGSVAPTVLGSFQLIGKETATSCPVVVTPTFHIRDNAINPIADITIGLVSPIGTITVIADLNFGLAATVLPQVVTGGADIHLGVDPANGWDTLLTDTAVVNIVRSVGIDNTGALVKFTPAATNCSVGALAAAAGTQALPGFFVGLDAGNCLTRIVPNARAVLFGHEDGGGRVNQDASGFLYDFTAKQLLIGSGILGAFNNLNSLIVGLNLTIQDTLHSVIAGSSHSISDADGMAVFGFSHSVTGTNSNSLISGVTHLLTGGVTGVILTGEANYALGDYAAGLGYGLETRYNQFVAGRYNVQQGQATQADGFDNAVIIGTGSSNVMRSNGFVIRYDNCWQFFPQQVFGAQVAIGPQPDDATAITQLAAMIGFAPTMTGLHAMVMVAGVAEVFFFNGVAWVRAY